MIGRRALILGLGGAIACPSAARAQQKAIPVMGYLASSSPGPSTPNVAAFRQGLSEAGYVDRRNVAIEYRWAEGSYDRLPALAADLVGRKVDVIVTSGSTPPALASEKRNLDDPDRLYRRQRPGEARPGRQSRPAGRQPHRLYRLLRRADGQAARTAVASWFPRPRVIALLVNPNDPEDTGRHIRDAQAAARAKGVQLPLLKAGTESEIDAAFDSLVQPACRRAPHRRRSVLQQPARAARGAWHHAMQFRRSIGGVSSPRQAG